MSTAQQNQIKTNIIQKDTPKGTKNDIFFSTEERPGTLIIVEGSDGSGKSTQLLIAKNLLESNGFFCVHSIWNSSIKMHEMQKKFKKFDINMPAAVFDTIYASDFIERYLTEMRGALKAGMVVLCDRYMYTALARGYARGIRMEHLKPFYDLYFPVPDLAFYFRIAVETAAERAIGRNPLKHYEAGMDVRYSENIIESFKKFQTKVIEGYDILAEQNGMHIIDGTAPVYKTTPIFIAEIAKYFERKYDVRLMGPHYTKEGYPIVSYSFSRFYILSFILMRPNISNCHALPGTLIIFEGADGSGKTTQVKTLKKMLENEGHEVTVSSWKTAPILGSFLSTNESLKKIDERILPETSLFMQSADLLYRIEREVIPAMKRGHIVILDRGLQTLIVRGLMIGMTDDQLRTGLLWWRNSIYKELFDKAHTIHITVDSETSLSRLTKRAWKERQKLLKKGEKGKMDGTLLTLHFINTLVYAPDGKKMTRQDKKNFIRQTQSQIIDNYSAVFSNEKSKAIEIDGIQKTQDIALNLKSQVLEMII